MKSTEKKIEELLQEEITGVQQVINDPEHKHKLPEIRHYTMGWHNALLHIKRKLSEK